MIQKLADKIRQTHAPVCIGLDPMLDYIPEHILKKAFDDFGETLLGAAEAVWQALLELFPQYPQYLMQAAVLDSLHGLIQ